MTTERKNTINDKAISRFLLPTVKNIDPSWLLKLIPDSLYQASKESLQGSRILTSEMHRQYRIAVPDKADLKPEQQWLIADNDSQKKLALRLGGLACADYMRRTIKKEHVKQLMTAMGDTEYRNILKQPILKVEGLTVDQYEGSLNTSHGGLFIMAVGIALLELTLNEDSTFIRLRMSFAFPIAAWDMRPKNLSVDIVQLLDLIAQSALIGVSHGNQ